MEPVALPATRSGGSATGALLVRVVAEEVLDPVAGWFDADQRKAAGRGRVPDQVVGALVLGGDQHAARAVHAGAEAGRDEIGSQVIRPVIDLHDQRSGPTGEAGQRG